MNKINIVGISLIIFVIATASTCAKNKADCHYYYTLKNNTSSAFYFGWSYDSALSRLDYPPTASPETYKCEANTEKSHRLNRCYEDDLSYFGKMYIFIFDAQVLETTSWDTVKHNYMLLKRYELTKVQLDSVNWYIKYP